MVSIVRSTYAPKIFYSCYGYLEINPVEYNNEHALVSFKASNHLNGKINKAQLKDKIQINLKTFYGERKVFQFEMKIDEKISELITKLVIEEDKLSDIAQDYIKWKYGKQHRLISTHCQIRELNPFKTFIEEHVHEGDNILLLPENMARFSESWKGHGIWLENNNKVAVKHDSDEHQYCLGEMGYIFGKHYIEFTLETEPIEKSVIIGVSQMRSDFSTNSSDYRGFYGYILSECKKISNIKGRMEQVEYGDIAKIKDKVGVMIEFTGTGCDVSFYINKINMGIAFSNLPPNTYYPSVILGLSGTRIRISNNVEFPDI